MKKEGANIQEPAVLAFSGNGSKLLQVLGVSTSVGKQMLSTYTKAIFEKVNGHPYAHVNFKIVIDPDKPKEATCKGGAFGKSDSNPCRYPKYDRYVTWHFKHRVYH